MTIVLVTIAMPLTFLASCMREKKDIVEYAFDPQTSYTLKETGVVRYVSDTSGITLYKVLADTWLMFGKAPEPYWFFPDGVYFEKFDSTYNMAANIIADTAYYYERRRLWELKGNVEALTAKGEHIRTSLLFFDQNKKTIHSDSYTTLTNPDGFVRSGTGFTSDQEMHQITIFNSSGPFLIENTRKTGDPIPKDSISADSDLQ